MQEGQPDLSEPQSGAEAREREDAAREREAGAENERAEAERQDELEHSERTQ